MVLKCAASRFFLFFFSALQWRPQCEWGGHSEIARHKFFSQFCLFGGLFPFRVDTKANKLQGSELFPLTKQGILPLCADVQQPYTENLFLLSICCSEINFSFVFFSDGANLHSVYFFSILWTLSQWVREVVPVALLQDYSHFFGIKRRTSCLPDVMR